MRTAELIRNILGITERTLIRHLHELVDAGVIERHDARTAPARVLLGLGIWHDAGPGAGELVWLGTKPHAAQCC